MAEPNELQVETPRKFVPHYAIDPIADCYESAVKLSHLLHLSMNGLGMVSRRPLLLAQLMDATRACGDEITPELKKDHSHATADAKFAQAEIDNGFPTLHASTVVAFWGALESAVEDMLVGIMCNEPKVLESEAFSKIKIPFAKYEQLDHEERMRFLLAEVQHNEVVGLAQGVDTFEKILQAFGLSGPVDPAIKKTLWNLNNLRNIIVHRGSRADRRFVENCPTFNVKLGERVTIDHKTYASLTNHVFDYIILITRRLAARYDVSISPNFPYDMPRAEVEDT